MRSLIQKSFAWGIHQVMRAYEPRIQTRKQPLFAGLAGRVLEIGPGTGPNLKYLPTDLNWVGLEPNPHMHPYLLREAERLGMRVELITGSAMEIPLPDASVDTVIGSLVLCSVPCQHQVIAEIRRVLKPGGEYRFIEHVAGEPGTWASWVQRLAKPVWHCCTDGCHPDRRTWESLEHGGFADLRLEHFRLRFPVVSPHIMGVAIR